MSRYEMITVLKDITGCGQFQEQSVGFKAAIVVVVVELVSYSLP